MSAESSSGLAQNQRQGAQRREEIVEAARQAGTLAVADLHVTFGVSPETIRRDLRALESSGRIARSYGALRAVESGVFETNHQRRASENRAEKERIAIAAIAQIGNAETVFLDEGFLPSRIAHLLPQEEPLTVVTTSLYIAQALSQRLEHNDCGRWASASANAGGGGHVGGGHVGNHGVGPGVYRGQWSD